MINSFQTLFNQRVTTAMNRTFGVTADYLRGNECFSVTVLADSTLFRSESAGDTVSFKTFDFLIDQDAEPFQAQYPEPQRKDKLQIVVNGEKRTFQLLSEPGQQHFEEDDLLGTKYRLRTKETPS